MGENWLSGPLTPLIHVKSKKNNGLTGLSRGCLRYDPRLPHALSALLWRDYLLVAKLFCDRQVSRDWSAQESEQAFPKLSGLGLQDRICQRAFPMASMNCQAEI